MRSPFWKNSTWAVSIGGMLLALVGFIHDVAPDLSAVIPGYTDHHAHALMALGTLLAALGSILARNGGIASAAHVEETVAGSQTVVLADKGQLPPSVPPGVAGP